MDEQLDEGMYMINGIPTKYVPDTTYNISLVINDTNVISDPDAARYGGFFAEGSEGAFQTNELFWVGDDGTYISHNANSNSQRNWTFQWTAPKEGAGDALFTIYFNVVNGVGTNAVSYTHLTLPTKA